MKLLFITDTHIRGTSPKNRLDDFPNTLESKLREVIGIIEKYDIDFLLHGGDLFDRPDVSISIMSSFASILKEVPVPTYIISGNHDIFGHNPSTINRTMLGLLDALDIVTLIKEDDIIYLEKDKIRVQLTGAPYSYNIDGEGEKTSYLVKELGADVDYAIHMVHGMLLNKPFIKGIPYTLVDDITHTRADITLSGHYHSGFNLMEIEGKYFINPGSMVRISNSLIEIDRIPKVALIELEDKINIRFLELKTAQPGKEILDRKEIENQIFKSERLFEFKQSVDAAVNFDKLDINDVLIEVSTAEGVSEDVRKEALRRIANSQMKDMEGKL